MTAIKPETAERLLAVCESWVNWQDSDGSNLPKGLTPLRYEEQMIEQMRDAIKEAKSPVIRKPWTATYIGSEPANV